MQVSILVKFGWNIYVIIRETVRRTVEERVFHYHCKQDKKHLINYWKLKSIILTLLDSGSASSIAYSQLYGEMYAIHLKGTLDLYFALQAENEPDKVYKPISNSIV